MSLARAAAAYAANCTDRPVFGARVSVSSSGGQADGPSRAPSVSDAARRVVFASDATNLAGNDGNGVRDVFVHEREDGSTARVSTAAGTVNDADGPSHREA